LSRWLRSEIAHIVLIMAGSCWGYLPTFSSFVPQNQKTYPSDMGIICTT